MEEGSRGTAVLVLGAFLLGAGFCSEGFDPSDAVFGPKMTETVKLFQRHYSLEADGGFGPQTRALAKEMYRFDFVALVAKSMSPNTKTSILVQPNGEYIPI